MSRERPRKNPSPILTPIKRRRSEISPARLGAISRVLIKELKKSMPSTTITSYYQKYPSNKSYPYLQTP
jgi:hypothetical protein